MVGNVEDYLLISSYIAQTKREASARAVEQNNSIRTEVNERTKPLNGICGIDMMRQAGEHPQTVEYRSQNASIPFNWRNTVSSHRKDS
jgi:hypothetical protein